MAQKYQVKELEQFKGTSEWTNEKQLEWELKRKEQSHKEELDRLAKEKSELYVENVLLKRELAEYSNIKDEVHSDIEKVWMFDSTLTKDLSAYHKRKRSEAIERAFYKIANAWI